jgi:hypothetical protein
MQRGWKGKPGAVSMSRRAWLGRKFPVDSGVLGMLYEDAMAARARITKCPDGKRPERKPRDRTIWSSKAWDRMK